jgi:hypothetical protein
MRDEQEISGASNDASEAPSLSAIRASGRQRKPTEKVTQSQVPVTEQQPLKRRRTRNNQPLITIFEDQPTPLATQSTSQSTQSGRQKGQDPFTSKKKRRKPKPAASSSTVKDPEPWEIDFEAASNSQSKFAILLEALGREDFPEALKIPERKAVPNFVEELDPLNPLWLWHKFFSPDVLWTITNHTNQNEAMHYKSVEHTRRERAWKDLTGPDVGAFIGAAMLMGVHPQDRLEDYWSTSEDKPRFPIQQEMSRERFQQISRYLKVNSPHEQPADPQREHDYHKIEPLMSSFRLACQSLISLPETVSIDENLLAATTRTQDLIQIDNKAAGKGYKVYTLCCGHYLYDWIYTSKRAPVAQAKNYIPQSEGYEDDAFTDTERMVLTLVEQLLDSHPEGFRFQIAFDNFFTTTRLFTELRAWGVGAFGTAKAGSGMPKAHLLLDRVCSKERNYGEIVNTVGKGVNFITFIDQGAVWMMSTVHDVANQPAGWRPLYKRPEASTHLANESILGETQIPYHQISFEYNHEMNGSDVSQQVWNSYAVNHPHRRNWWPLFWHLVAASIANVLYLYKLQGHSQLSHLQLQQRLGLQLLRNPASISRKIEPAPATFTRPSLLRRPTDEHRWTRCSRRYCVACKPRGRQRGLGRRRRQILQELGINTTTTQPIPEKRQRSGKRTTWACFECDVALCKDSWCWQRHHDEDIPSSEDEGQGTSQS